MNLIRFAFSTTLAFAIVVVPTGAVETPFTAYKDGYANSTAYSGNSRALIVRAGDTKAWISHALLDAAGRNPVNARLEIYVVDVVHDGQIKAYLADSLNSLENQTHLSNLHEADSVGTAAIKAIDAIQHMVSIPLSAAFLKRVSDGTYSGLVLEGAGGLDAQIGALEGSHSAILYLNYATSGTIADSMLVDSVALRLTSKYPNALKGATGLKGDKGDPGPQGIQGDQGAQGPRGDTGAKGDNGAPADQSPIFKLILNRGQLAYYAFDVFQGLPATTPDSSGQGNTLTLSTNGINKIRVAAGDSAIQLNGSGYATAPNASAFNPYGEIMLSAAVELASGTLPDTQTLISKKNQYELALVKDAGQIKLRCRFKTSLADWAWKGDGVLPLSDTVWTTVAASYDGNVIRAFVNGAQTFYQAFSNGPLAVDTTNSLYIGSRAPGIAGFKGNLDRVKILSYAASAQDSIALLPGRVTTSQVVSDSVAGLSALLALKANLSGANFSGNVGIGGGHELQLYSLDNSVAARIVNPATITRQIAFLAGDASFGEKMRIDGNGNVGIGTSTPTAKLSVFGHDDIKGDDIQIHGDSSSSSKYGIVNVNDSAAYLRLGYFNGTAMKTIFMDGNVGIGAVTPNWGLYVATQASSGVARIGGIDYGAATVLSVAPGTINFDAPGVGGGRMIISGVTGNVGIGTANPSVKLEVAGRIKDSTGFITPVGELTMFAGSTAPPGWLLCNGSAVNRTTYASLFAAIGSAWGAGDGVTTFNLPDMRGRAPIGAGAGSGLTNRTLGQTLGEETHVLTIAEMPSHTHAYIMDQACCAGNSGSGGQPLTHSLTQTNTTAAGGSAGHNNMQPSAVVNYIIKY